MRLSYDYIEEKAIDILTKNDFCKPGFSVEKLSKRLGVEVFGKNLDDDVSGLFVIIDDKPIISYNLNQSSKERRRFTIAHELGHFLLHSSNKKIFIDKTPKVLYRNSASSSGELLQEKEANHFAAALLMPHSLVKSEFDNIPDNTDKPITYLANIFKVSSQAMTFRLANLGYDLGLY